MSSVGDVKRRLPNDFVEDLYNFFSPVTADKILLGMAKERHTTLRVNTIKYNISDLINYFKEINIKHDRIPWYKDGLIIKNAKEKDIERLEIYNKGYIYLQSLSSMVPPMILNPKRGEKILDLTAAPGSKTTQIAALMSNEGYVLANELDKIRCEKLRFNIERQGVVIADVVIGRGEKVGETHPEFFDKVLIDAPCSGEGRFLISDVKTYKFWSRKEVKRLVSMQKKLLESGYRAVKRGGTLVYSTCTLNSSENEEVIDWGINNLNLRIIPIDTQISERLHLLNLHEKKSSTSNTIRIAPSCNMEGFFICKMKKI